MNKRCYKQCFYVLKGKIFLKEKINELRRKSLCLPESPGVYIMKNVSDEIIYIGKAKILKNRVSQYFRSQKNHAEKVRKMVSQVESFEYIVTDSEFEALVLECSLIKQHSPRYNILLKDDKGYHYIKITKDEWPRIFSVNKVDDDGAVYIGPYMSAWTVKKSVDEVCKIFLLPTCNRSFSKVRIKGRPCLSYYIKQCSAPCIGAIRQDAYKEAFKEAVDFLRGSDSASMSNMIKKMNEASDNLEFERAAKIRDRISAIKKLSEKQKVVEIKTKDQDVFAMAKTDKNVCFEVFKIRSGMFIDKEEFVFGEIVAEDVARAEFIQQFYLLRSDIPSQITIDGHVDGRDVVEKWLSKRSGKKVKIVVPQKGDRAKLVMMCKSNAEESLLRKSELRSRDESVLNDLRECLNLEKTPFYIEAYDISNLAGSDVVAGMIVYEDAKPNKSMYKKFKINSVSGPDDYQSMREVITRRLKEFEKMSAQGEKNGFARLPDLILLDGGKGHVKVIQDVMNEMGYKIPVFGMVKNNKHRTKAISKDNGEIDISKNRKLFAFVTKIQDEVHRFAISYHRTKKKKSTIKTKLMEIPNVGKVRAAALFKHFKMLDRISQASVEELMFVPEIDERSAVSIYNYFHERNS